MSKYRNLQKEASVLGIKAVGVSAADLEKAIKNATIGNDEIPSKVEGSPEESPKEEQSNDADAIVYNGKHKVRTYTFEQHGKDYVKLANQFVSHPEREGYRVELVKVESKITCPNCGNKFRY